MLSPHGVVDARFAPADLAQRERARRLVGDPEADVPGSDQLAGRAADGLQHGVGPVARADEPAEPGEDPEIGGRTPHTSCRIPHDP
jgi:hypothetical protein